MANESKAEKRRRKDRYGDGYRDSHSWKSSDWNHGSHSDWRDGWNEGWSKSSSWKGSGWSDRWSSGWSSQEWSAESWDKSDEHEEAPAQPSLRRVVQLTARPSKDVRDKSPPKQTPRVRLQARGRDREPRESSRRGEAAESIRRVDCAPSPPSPMSVGSSVVEEESKPKGKSPSRGMAPHASSHSAAAADIEYDELRMAEPVLPLERTETRRARSSSRTKRLAAAEEAARFAAPPAGKPLPPEPKATSNRKRRETCEVAQPAKTERPPSAGVMRGVAESASIPADVHVQRSAAVSLSPRPAVQAPSRPEKVHRAKKQRTKATATVVGTVPGPSGTARAAVGSPAASHGQSAGSQAQMPEAPARVHRHRSRASSKPAREAQAGSSKVSTAGSPHTAATRQEDTADAGAGFHEELQTELKDKVAEKLGALQIDDAELVAEYLVVMSVENMPREEQMRELPFLKEVPGIMDAVEEYKQEMLRRGVAGTKKQHTPKAPLRAQLTPNPNSDDPADQAAGPQRRIKKGRAASSSSSNRPQKKKSYVVVTKKLKLQPNPDQAEESDAAREESQMVTSGSDSEASHSSAKAESEEKPNAAEQAAAATDKKNELLAEMTRRLQEIMPKLSDMSLSEQTREQWQAMALKIQENLKKLDDNANEQFMMYSQAPPAAHMA